jgi:hypothetical protein
MQKISHYGDGASLSRKAAPHLVHADAHAAKQMSASGYGGGGKPPAKYSSYSGGKDDEGGKGKEWYGGHTSPEPQYDHNAPLNNASAPKKKPANIQAQLWDDKKKSSPKASGSDPKPKPDKPNKRKSFPSSPKDVPSKKEPYSPPTKKDKK